MAQIELSETGEWEGKKERTQERRGRKRRGKRERRVGGRGKSK